MNNNNGKSVNYSIFVLALTIVLLIALSFIPENIQLFSYKVKPVHLFEDIKKTEQPAATSAKDIPVLEAGVSSSDTKEITEALFTAVVAGAVATENYYNTMGSIEGNTSQMSNVCRALKSSGGSQVRIAYYGDSFLEGDNICADLRDLLQDKFGGGGVGFVNMNNRDVAWRSSTTQTFSNDWQELSVLLGTPKEPMGMSGYSFKPKTNNSWAKFETTWRFKNARDFNVVRFFYSDAKATNIKYSINNEADKSMALTAGSGVKQLKISYPGAGKSVKISATEAWSGYFYGVSLEKNTGVYVDNYPLRGNDGTALNRVEPITYKGFNSLLDYKLVILHFGLNVLSSGKNINSYKDELIRTINHMKASFPNSSFLLVCAADKIETKGTQFVPNDNVQTLVNAQKDAAKATGIAYWDLFNAMGGKGSMIKWFQSNPQLALSDNHLTAEGSKKVGVMLADAIIGICNGF